MRPGPTTGDAGTGVQMALAISAAYAQKLRTGKGQLIELSMQEAMTYYLRTATAGTQWGEQAAPRTGNGQLPTMSLYPCTGGGPNDYVFVMAVTPRMWEDLARAIGREDFIDDPRFKRQADRLANQQVLRDEITAWTSQRDKYQAMRELAEAGVPASAVLDTHDLFENPHLQQRGFIRTVDHEVHGRVRLLGWPARMSESRVEIKAAPRLGRHSREIVAEDLKLSDDAIGQLIADGVISEAEPL